MLEEIDITKIRDAIFAPPLPTDYIAGGETGVVFETRKPTGQWDPELPGDELQYTLDRYDLSNCTNMTTAHSFETQLKWNLLNNKIPTNNVQKLIELGLIKNDNVVNISERHNALKSGTKVGVGNYLNAPWEAFRKFGILADADLPFDRSKSVAEYYDPKCLNSELEAKALKVLEILDIQYEWVAPDVMSMMYHLQHAPLAVIVAPCFGWSKDEIVKACTVQPCHAVEVNGFIINQFKKIFDSYIPTRKKLAWDYIIAASIKGVVTPKQIETPKPKPEPAFRHAFNRDIIFGQRSAEVAALQQALKINGTFPTKVLATGYYGEITRQAVKAFQNKYAVASAMELRIVNGKRVGAKTRAKLNQLFNK